MSRSLWSKIQQATRFNGSSSSSSIRDQHHQPAYTLYHNDTSHIDIHSTPLDSPSQSTLIYDQVAGRHRVIGHPLTGKVLAAAILTSFLAGLVLGLTTHGKVSVESHSDQGSNRPSTSQVTGWRFSL